MAEEGGGKDGKGGKGSGTPNPNVKPLIDHINASMQASDALLGDVLKMQETFLQGATSTIDKLVKEVNVPPSDLADQIKTLNGDVVKMTSQIIGGLPTDLMSGSKKKDG